MADELGESDGFKRIPASEILAKIEKGEAVEYDQAFIRGDLDISKINLPKDDDKIFVLSQIKIINSKIFGKVDLGNAVLGKSVDFSGSEFMLAASFDRIQFNDDSRFIETEFLLGASFDETRFNKGASFNKAKFNLGSSFKRAQFDTNAWFIKAEFLCNSDFIGAFFKGEAEFMEAVFTGKADFGETRFVEDVCFSSALFSHHTIFKDAQFCKKSYFNLAHFYGDINFSRTQFANVVNFHNAQIEKNSIFAGARFREEIDFTESKFRGNIDFREAQFIKDVCFIGAQFTGDVLTFKDAEFGIPKSQEDACRRAKNLLEKNGNREEAGYHFYREMEAKRKQKPWYVRYPEFFFIQLIFGYGVHPFRLMLCWFAIATIFAFFYLAKGGIISKLPASSLPQTLSYFVECFYFSIVTAVTPGYGKYELTSWVYQVLASVEAIFGTFMWAAFIATFARKYMR
jgi:hypothetical protein